MEEKKKNVPKSVNRMNKDNPLNKFYHVIEIVKFKQMDIVSVLMGTYEPIVLLEDDV